MDRQTGGGTAFLGGLGGMIALLVGDATVDQSLWYEQWFVTLFAVSALCIVIGLYSIASTYLPLPVPRTLNERDMTRQGRQHEQHEASQRLLLTRALQVAYQDGLRWYGEGGFKASDWAPWQKRTFLLINAALGQGEATCFLSDWGSGEQKLTGIAARLQWLADLIDRVDSVAPLTLRPDFNGKDWVSSR